MNCCKFRGILQLNRLPIYKFHLNQPKNNYAKKDTGSVSMLGGTLKKKKLGKVGSAMEKKMLPVESDVQKLIKFVCGSNIYKTGEDVQLKSDNEYPEWLWNLRTGPPPPLEELDPETKEYWKYIRRHGMLRKNRLAQLKRF